MEDKRKNYIVGVSIGGSGQFTALAIMERIDQKDNQSKYHLVKVERFPLRTSYPEIAARLKVIWESIDIYDEGLVMYNGNVLERKPKHNDRKLILDITGAGAPAVKCLSKDLHVDTEVIITNGAEAQKGENYKRWSVPKKDLAGAVEILLQTERIAIPGTLPEKDSLLKELLNFRVDKVKLKKGVEPDEVFWRENDNDDMVFSAALAAWWGETLWRPPFRMGPVKGSVRYKSTWDY